MASKRPLGALTRLTKITKKPEVLLGKDNQEIMVIWHAGNFYCLGARCTHAGAPIAEGTVNEQVLTCPWHYSQFDIATGVVLRGPAKKPLKFYKSELRDGSLFVDL